MSTPAAAPPLPIHTAIDRPHFALQFDDYHQQYDACVLGMWVFLVTEVMFFGAIFTGYAVYRMLHHDAFAMASNELDITLGTINTFVLLTSSLTMALAVRAGHVGNSKRVGQLIVLTMILGATFLGIKFFEYYHKYEDHMAPAFGLPFEAPKAVNDAGLAGPFQLFLSFYFGMTGVHALHMIIGLGLLSQFLPRSSRIAPAPGAAVLSALNIEVVGLYWHFVDLVWIFLFPMLYLIDRSDTI